MASEPDDDAPPLLPSHDKFSAEAGALDWDALRQRSLAPGGFGKDRAAIWPRLLQVDVVELAYGVREKDTITHPDERQIRLDTDRSFVLYPVEENVGDRVQRQQELNELITALFRRHPGLSYFQGYHDIITVLFLTLPPVVQLQACEKLSLHRLRDSMGRTLEPLLGLLRILLRLLRLADPTYAALLEEQSPLPYPALSHLLTLFAHDVPSLPLAQHIFDYLLTRPPIAVVYLAAAVILARREEVIKLEKEGEEGMIHSVLSGLPQLIDEVEPENVAQEDKAKEEDTGLQTRTPETGGGSEAVSSPESPSVQVQIEEQPLADESTLVDIVREQHADVTHDDEMQEEREIDDTEMTLADSSSPVPILKELSSSLFPALDDFPPPPAATRKEFTSSPDATVVGSSPSPAPESEEDSSSSPADKEDDVSFPAPAPYQSTSPTPSPPDFGEPPLPPHLIHPRPTPASHPSSPSKRAPESIPLPPSPRPAQSLTAFLTHADTHLSLFPPSHPKLRLAQTMGPASVVHTWSEHSTYQSVKPISDSEAEGLVVRAEDIVFPYAESDSDKDEDEGEYSDASGEEGEASDEGERPRGWFGLRLRRRHQHGRGKEKEGKEKEKEERPRAHRRKLHKRRRALFHALMLERRAMLAGAALVLGIAMAVSLYGGRTRSGAVTMGLESAGRVVSAVVGVGFKGAVWGGGA
ncbi:hypothetical protein EW146_g3168 [Bondarzewia mesenterica]|uniref:Rab-GAP TBC domain-containing protein n=1 Tax=Bondarzewia mesenterica TaxID=1095465 RepID=A0A4S4M4B2_9AGAM|nr:hypothetical protein EW146_g3168 [Bondarzewia mesenterica]